MSHGLIIVDSPDKVNTIRGMLPEYEVATIPQGSSDIASLNVSNYTDIIIAADQGGAGESFCYDVASQIPKISKSIVLSEITERSLRKAIIEGREIVNESTAAVAYHKRQQLNALVDQPISDIMEFDFKKHGVGMTPKGISLELAPALHMIAENHRRIDEYIPDTYEQVSVDYNVNGISFRCFLKERFTQDQEELMAELIATLRNNEHVVTKFRQKTRDEAPHSPLSIGKLSRSAFYLFGYAPSITKQLAKELYEMGLITNPVTSGIEIEPQVIEEIVAALERTVAPEYIFSRDRKYKSHSKGLAIRPTAFDESMTPNFVKEAHNLNEQQNDLYEFVWYRTLATQMANAIYDASTIEIESGGHIYGAQANICVFEGWQSLRGNYLSEAEQSENDMRNWVVSLPNVRVDQTIYPIDISAKTCHTKAPGRYGLGRFITQLEKFVDSTRINDMIALLEEREYIRVDKGMISISALGLKVDSWVHSRTPWLQDSANAVVLKQAIEAVSDGDKGAADTLFEEYQELIENLKETVAYVERSYWPPSSAQRDTVIHLAKKNNISNDMLNDILKYQVSCDAFIKKYRRVYQGVGPCPACKKEGRKGEVKEYDKHFGCTQFKKGCDFKLWKNGLQRQFSALRKPQTNEEISSIVKGALTGEPMIIENLISKRGNIFPGKFIIEKENEYWNLKMKFVKGKQ